MIAVVKRRRAEERMSHEPTETRHFIQSGVCVSKRNEDGISLTMKSFNQSPVSKIRRKGLNCANRTDAYLEMWWLEPALWTLHTQGEDKSNP